MANVIKIKRSNTSGVVPATLQDGELAINQADKVLFYKDNLGVIQSFSLVDAGKNWIIYASQWPTNPSLNTNIAGGKVYNYTLNNVTIYRFVPTIYNPTQDAFYSNFDGINLTNLITTRG